MLALTDGDACRGQYYGACVSRPFNWPCTFSCGAGDAGSTIVLVNFIQQRRPDDSSTGAGGGNGQSGALNKGQRTSTGLTTLLQVRIAYVAVELTLTCLPFIAVLGM